jgi:hypothetical protein
MQTATSQEVAHGCRSLISTINDKHHSLVGWTVILDQEDGYISSLSPDAEASFFSSSSPSKQNNK